MSVQQLARDYTRAAIHTLAEIMRDTNQNAASRVAAANSILDRAWGKPMQMLAMSNEDSPGALHLLAAQIISQEIAAERAEEGPPTLDGNTVTNTPETNAVDAPPALE